MKGKLDIRKKGGNNGTEAESGVQTRKFDTERNSSTKTYTSEAVLGLVLLEGIDRVVDKGKADALAASEGNLKAEGDDLVGSGLEGLGEDVAQLLVGDAGTRGVHHLEHL